MTSRQINLSIATTGEAPGPAFSYHLRFDGAVVASNQVLTEEESQRVRELSREYGELFEHPEGPKASENSLAAIGSELFSIWLAPFWDRLEANAPTGASTHLLISSSSPEVLNLPWELLRPPHGEAIGIDGKWTLRRLPEGEARLGPDSHELPPGPLRVLYMVAAPTDQPDLDFEKEEELLLRALSRAGHEAGFDSGDLGSFDELEQRISEFRPHIVHLTGHGVAGNDTAHFAFEDEQGETDLRSASEIGQLFAGQGVQCAFISACQAGRAPARNAQNGLAQGLLREGVPLVIGWSASILDDVATEVGARFYREVANGRTSVDRALISARQHARRQFARRGDPSWSLPVLYSATHQGHLFDPAREEARPRPTLRLEALPGMSEEGFTPHFIGRRRELQQLLPSLRSGKIQLAVLTGLGGAGKSTLATRLTRKLEADGWRPIAVSSTDDLPLTAAALLETCGDAFLTAGLHHAHARLRDPGLETAERLRLVVNTLNEHRFVLVLDNFESNLDEASGKILDAEIALFYKYLLARLQGLSRAIVTSRYLPADAPLPLKAREWQLGEFGEGAFLKFMLRDATVETRYREGEITHELLVQLHGILGGTPRFLNQIRKLLETISARELREELSAVSLPTAGESPRALQAARDRYCEQIFTARLYERLSPQARQMLRRVAVLTLAVPVEGLAAVGGMAADAARAAADEASRMALLHHLPADPPLWSVYGLLRGWLTAPERMEDDELRLAHRQAGDYLEQIDQEERETELGVSLVVLRQERRAHYIAAKAWDKAREVTDTLSSFFIRRGLYGEVERLNRELLDYGEDHKTLFWIGSSFIERAEYEKARGWFDRSLKLARRLKDMEGQAAAFHQLASIDVHQCNYKDGRKSLRRALRLRQKTGDKHGEITTLYQLATVDVLEGKYARARTNLEQILVMNEDIKDSVLEAATWHQLGTIDIYRNELAEARDKFIRALGIKREIGDLSGESATLHQLATIDIHDRDLVAARVKLRRALAIKQQISDRAGEGASWHALGTVELLEHNYPAAREKFMRSLAIRQQIGDLAGEAATWHQLSGLAIAREDSELALRLATLSWVLHVSIGHGHADLALESVAGISADLGYPMPRLEELIREVHDEYAEDRGARLLQQIGSDPEG